MQYPTFPDARDRPGLIERRRLSRQSFSARGD